MYGAAADCEGEYNEQAVSSRVIGIIGSRDFASKSHGRGLQYDRERSGFGVENF